jgi:hypothetical protein
MSLAWNTKQLLDASATTADSSTPVEYHLQTGRELYDARIISANRYTSSAGEWVVNQDLYSVSVVSRPFSALPQELCLSFNCYYKKEIVSGDSFLVGPPIDQVALEFTAILSLLAREPILLLGTRRIGNRPIIDQYPYSLPREVLHARPPAAPIDSAELMAIIRGLGQSTNQGMVDAALAATKLYYAGLSFARFDLSVAYVSLISAIECLAGYAYKMLQFSFDNVPKFESLKSTLDKLSSLAGGDALVGQLKKELIASEHFLIRKFCLLIADLLMDDFWTTPDDRYYEAPPIGGPEIKQRLTKSLGCPENKEALTKALKAVYNTRSAYVHTGTPFPPYIGFGGISPLPAEAVMTVMDVSTEKRIPVFIWFERVAHFVIMEYLRRSFAPEFITAREAKKRELTRLQELIRNLAENVRTSLQGLVSRTAGFLGTSMVHPLFPNKEWADEEATVIALRDAAVIGTNDPTMAGTSWLKDREVGEAVGEFFLAQRQIRFAAANSCSQKGGSSFWKKSISR